MILTLCLYLIIALLLLIYAWFKWNFSYWSKHKSVPSVLGRIFSDNLIDVICMKTNFYARLKVIYEDPKYQDEAAVGVYGAYIPGLLIREPELIKSILIKDFDRFHDRLLRTSSKHDPMGNQKLFFAPYPIWREMRTKFSQIFSSGKLKNFYSNNQQVCATLEKVLVPNGDRVVKDVWHLSGCFNIDVMASFLGVTSDCLNDPNGLFQNAVLELGKYNLVRALNYVVLFFIPGLSNYFRVRVAPKHLETIIKSYFECALKEREQSAVSRNDVIDICLKYKREFKGTEEELKIFMDGLTAQAIMFMMAGVETTMATITYTLFELAKHPEIQQRLRGEIINLFEETNGEVVWESLNKLEYMDCVINEAMRLYPALPVLERQFGKTPDRSSYSLKPYYDYSIPDGMPVYISIPGLHHDPKFWPNPTKFDPERFSAANKNSLNSMAFLPFGDGPRNCIGGSLGRMMVKSMLAYTLRNHYYGVCDRTSEKIKFDVNATTLQPDGAVYLEIVRDDLYAKRCGKN